MQKRMRADEGPQSAAAYTGAGQKRQAGGSVGLKNRFSKINMLGMWFYNTTISFDRNRDREVHESCPGRHGLAWAGRCMSCGIDNIR